MKEVYYKGEPYQFEMLELDGKRLFHLYKNGVVVHAVNQNDLDSKSLVSLILDDYYRDAEPKNRLEILG